MALAAPVLYRRCLDGCWKVVQKVVLLVSLISILTLFYRIIKKGINKCFKTLCFLFIQQVIQCFVYVYILLIGDGQLYLLICKAFGILNDCNFLCYFTNVFMLKTLVPRL